MVSLPGKLPIFLASGRFLCAQPSLVSHPLSPPSSLRAGTGGEGEEMSGERAADRTNDVSERPD